MRLSGGLPAAERADEPTWLGAVEHDGRGLAVPVGAEPDESGRSGGAYMRAVLACVDDERRAQFRGERGEGPPRLRAVLQRARVVAEEEVDLAAAGDALVGGRDGSAFRPAGGAGGNRAAPRRVRGCGRGRGRAPRRRRGSPPRAEARGQPGAAGHRRRGGSGALPGRAAGSRGRRGRRGTLTHLEHRLETCAALQSAHAAELRQPEARHRPTVSQW
jgi:hypothetical protein